MKTGYVVFFLLFTHFSYCQLDETFSDSDFTNNPAWQGDSAFFKINSAFSLQSQGPASSGSIQLSTKNNSVTSTQWEFLVRMDFEPSTTNYPKVYLTSDQPNLKGSLNGYYIKVGGENGTTDHLELYRQTGISSVKLISGKAGNAGKPVNTIRIRVSRDYSGNWSLFSDTSGHYNFSLEGTAYDSTYTNSSSFGVVCTHTSTRKDLFYFDDLKISSVPLFPVSAEALSDTEITLSFSKAIEQQSAENSDNYYLEGMGKPSSVIQTSVISVNLRFNETLIKGTNQVKIKSIEDLKGDILGDTLFTFIIDPPLHYADILITEIYPDPTPSNGLPEEEFVELYNTTNDTLNLTGFSFSDGSTVSHLGNTSINPRSYLILSSGSGSNLYSTIGNTLSISPWPSLNNSGDHLVLKDSKGRLIFQLDYSADWYKNDEKKEGGWSLEMVNFSNFCSSSNWKASEAFSGGTPGMQNSVFSLAKDTTAPVFLSFDIEDSLHIVLQWDEELDTLQIPSVTCGGELLPTYFKSINTMGVIFSPENTEDCLLEIEKVKDCKGNSISSVSFPLIFPQKEDSLDIIINEILFNPRPGGVDFVELYNRSPKVIDLKNWKIASLKNGDTTFASLFFSSHLISPFSYLAFCPSSSILESQYYVNYPERIIDTNPFPGFNDDQGTILIFNDQNHIIDRFDYNENYHLSILQDKEGVSLERISFNQPSNNPNNWHSASASSGFASPGVENSQHFESSPNDQFRAEPKVFSPNQDGEKDFTLIHYQFDSPGYICNLSVFDLSGRKINILAENFLAGKEGYFEWDGTDNSGSLSAPGLYILFLEAFNSNGRSSRWKGTVILSQKF